MFTQHVLLKSEDSNKVTTIIKGNRSVVLNLFWKLTPAENLKKATDPLLEKYRQAQRFKNIKFQSITGLLKPT